MVISIRVTEEEVAVVLDKKTSAQKIRDYFKTSKWHALTKKQEERGEYKSKYYIQSRRRAAASL